MVTDEALLAETSKSGPENLYRLHVFWCSLCFQMITILKHIHRGFSLGESRCTCAGAVLYLNNGLQSDSIGIKKGIFSNGNNYLRYIWGIEIAFKYLCDEVKYRNRNIHLFVDYQSAIVSAFGI